MSQDILGLRSQILANARLLLGVRGVAQHPTLPSLASDSTLVTSSLSSAPGPAPSDANLDIVIFGHVNIDFTAAIMVDLVPAIEGASASSPEASLRRLLLATAELLHKFMPKVGSHQRTIHGGGVFDEDMISKDLVEAQKKAT